MGCLLGNLVIDLVEHDNSFRTHLQQVFQDWEREISIPLHQAKADFKSALDPDLLAEQILLIIEGVMLMGKLRDNEGYIRCDFDLARTLVKDSFETR